MHNQFILFSFRQKLNVKIFYILYIKFLFYFLVGLFSFNPFYVVFGVSINITYSNTIYYIYSQDVVLIYSLLIYAFALFHIIFTS
jgi:hypothetical protein